MTTNRTNTTRLMQALGGDPSGAGLPFANGIQPVLDVGKTGWLPRNIFGHNTLLGGVAAERGTVQLITAVPTLVHAYVMDPTAGGVRIAASGFQGSNPTPFGGLTRQIPGSITVLGERVTNFTGGRNILYTGTSTAFPTFPWITADVGATQNAIELTPLTPFPMPPNAIFTLQADTVNTAAFYWFMWEEALVESSP